MEPDFAPPWRVLALAHHRAREPRLALDALDKAREVSRCDDGLELFVRALASWQAGDRSQATDCRDRAVRWTRNHRPHDPELNHLGHEAEELMGPPTP